jgi:hypothetical protein
VCGEDVGKIHDGLDSMSDLPKVRFNPTMTTVIAVAGLVVAIGGWGNSCREIDQQRQALDQQRDALKTERAAREREIDLLQRQTAVAEAGLRAIVVPEQPTIRGYRLLPNGSAGLTIGLVNQSEGIALRGGISVTVVKGAIPSDIVGIDPFGIGFVPIVEAASFPSFAALRGGARIALVATVPRRVVRA